MIDHWPSWMWMGLPGPIWMLARIGFAMSRKVANRISDARAITISGMMMLM